MLDFLSKLRQERRIEGARARPIKEASALVLLGSVGGFAGWWFIQLFGMIPTCELLKYGGGVVGAFFFGYAKIEHSVRPRRRAGRV